MTTVVRHRLEVTPWLLARNDDAPAPGRVTVDCGCAGCGQLRRMLLPAGVWSLEHRHGERWTAHLVELPPRSPAPAAVAEVVELAPALDVEALAAGLAEAFATTT